MDRIAHNNSSDALNTYTAAVANANLCDATPANVCAETYDVLAASEAAAAVCTDTQLATYDAWEIICADGEGLDDELSRFSIELDCATAGCPVGNQLTLEIVWESYASRGDPRLSENTIITRGDTGDTDTVSANVERYRQVFVP